MQELRSALVKAFQSLVKTGNLNKTAVLDVFHKRAAT